MMVVMVVVMVMVMVVVMVVVVVVVMVVMVGSLPVTTGLESPVCHYRSGVTGLELPVWQVRQSWNFPAWQPRAVHRHDIDKERGDGLFRPLSGCLSHVPWDH